MRRPSVLVAVILAVGFAGAVIALRAREGNPQFVAQQQASVPVTADALQELLLTTSDPRPGHGGRAVAARCVPGGASALADPWSCVVRYRRLPRIRFAVTVHADRSIDGSGRPQGADTGAVLTVSGCCVRAR